MVLYISICKFVHEPDIELEQIYQDITAESSTCHKVFISH